MVRKRRHLGDGSAFARAAERHVVPIRLESELPIRPWKPVQIVRLPEWRLAVEPTIGLKFGNRAPFRDPQHLINQLARTHFKPAVFSADPLGQRANYLMVA